MQADHMINYRDESGGWEARLGPGGEFLGGVLVEPSASFNAKRGDPVLPVSSRDVLKQDLQAAGTIGEVKAAILKWLG